MTHTPYGVRLGVALALTLSTLTASPASADDGGMGTPAPVVEVGAPLDPIPVSMPCPSVIDVSSVQTVTDWHAITGLERTVSRQSATIARLRAALREARR